MDPSRPLTSIKHIITIDFVMNEKFDWSCVEAEWSVNTTLQGSLDYALNMQISKRLSRFSRSIAHAVL